MTLSERLHAVECAELARENVRLRASRDSLQALADDLRRQVRDVVVDVRDPVRASSL
jgi:hypothetical protein